MKNKFQKMPLILSTIFFVFCSATFIFLYTEINNNSQKAQLGTMAWQTENQRRSDLQSLDRSLQKVEGERAKLETHFAKSSDVVPFLNTVEKLAPQVGASAQVDSVNVLPDSGGLTVGLKASGSFEQIYKFLTLLENSPYELDFLGVDVHKVGAASDKNAKVAKWEAVFRIQLLSFVP